MVKTLRLREEWLRKVADQFASHVEKAAGQPLPPFRVACGFPSRGGIKGGKKWTRGECWIAEASADGHAEIFINPGIDNADTVAAILAHEMMHAALGAEIAHKKPFQTAMKKLGHVAPFTTSNPTDEFFAWSRPIIEAAGPYPHAELRTDRAAGAPKKQSTRNLKVACEECGYTVRVARKWIVEKGAPHCPEHGAMKCEAIDAAEEPGELEQALAGLGMM